MKSISKAHKLVRGFMNDVRPLEDEPLKKSLYELSPLVVHKDRNKVRNDTRSHTLSYSLTPENLKVPEPFVKLYNMFRSEIDEDEPFACNIHYIASMPKAEITIPRPSPCVVGRFLYNVGYREIYFLHRDAISDSSVGNVMRSHATEDMMNNLTTMVPGDYVLYMNAGVVCDYSITVRSVPPHSYTTSTNTNTMPTSHKFIRFPGQKICVVVDIISLDPNYLKVVREKMNMLSDITEDEILDSVNNMNLNVLKRKKEETPVDEELRKEMEGS